MSKGLLLFSGGLDSILAYNILKRASKAEITGIFFETPFFRSEKAELYAQANNIPLQIYPIFNDYIPILTKPKHGYGRFLNPCIDCHSFMITNLLDKRISLNADFIASGEVLGQRPMSQNRRAFDMMKRNIKGIEYLVRPLSAMLMDETEPEKKGIIERKKLFNIRGRGRYRQLELAAEWGITHFPSPSGGCLLTMREYSNKVRRLIDMNMLTENNAALMKYGRVFFYNKGFAVIGRDEMQNNDIIKHSKLQYQARHGKGPVGTISGELDDGEFEDFMETMRNYSAEKDSGNDIIIMQ